MVSRYHEHQGFAYSTGRLKSHFITMQHRNPETQKYHEEAIEGLKGTKQLSLKDIKTTKKSKKLEKVEFKVAKDVKMDVPVTIDIEDFIAVDLKEIRQKGLRVINVNPGKVYFAKNGSVKGVEFTK